MRWSGETLCASSKVSTMLLIGRVCTKASMLIFPEAEGLPPAILPILIPVEILGMFTKPFALAIRLFANMTAGHVVILSLVSFIFILKSPFVAIGTVPFSLFIGMLELLVAFIQAYIFTMLTALFIGMSAHPAH